MNEVKIAYIEKKMEENLLETREKGEVNSRKCCIK